MNCPKCGASLAPGAKFCVTCGTPCNTQNAMNPQYQAPQQGQYAQPQQYVQQPQQQYAQQPQQSAAPKTPATKFDFKQVLAQLSLMFKPLWTKIKPIATNKKMVSIIAGGFALVVILAILCSVLTSGNGYINAKQAIVVVSNGDDLSVIVNNKELKTKISADSVSKFALSLDGSAAAVLTNENELYGISGKKVVKLAEDVKSFVLSASGKGVAYVVKDEDASTLYVSKINKAKGTEICDSVSGDYAISPDGKSVAYYEVSGEGSEMTSELMLFKGKKSVDLTDDEGTALLGLSNGGKQVYVAVTEKNSEGNYETELYSYNQKGNRTKLSSMNSDSSVRFNADHTQIMFTNDDGKTCVSTKGKEAKRAYSESLSLVAPRTAYSLRASIMGSGVSVADSSTYPVKDLYNHVYSSGDKVIVLKKNSDKNIKLLSNVSSARLDDSAEYIYYIKNKELRVSEISAGERASEKYKTIVDDTISSYIVTSNRKKVYFIDDRGTLYSTNGKKRSIPRELADDVTSLVMNNKDIVYYTSDGDLYASKNGKKGSKVLSDCDGVLGSNPGIVYAVSDDSLYISAGAKKPKKILTVD